MAYRRYSRSRSSSRRYSAPRRRTRTRRRRSMRGGATQRIVIQVVGGAGGQVPVTGTTIGGKGARTLRRRF